MTSAKVVSCSDQADWHKPISSSYLVMLRRYQSYIRDKSSIQVPALDMQAADEYVESMISMARLIPLFNEFEKNLGHRAFGVDVGRYMHPSDYGIFGYFLMNCPTLGKSLESAARLKSVRNPNVTASVNLEKGLFNYEIHTPCTDPIIDALVELDFSTAFQFGKLLVGPHREDFVSLESIYFKHSPRGPIEIYQERFGCPVFFEQDRNYAILSEEVVSLPVCAANPKVLSALEHKVEALFQRDGMVESRLSTNVKALLTRTAPTNFPSAQELAQQFNMSLSSLKKNLKDEGTCYQNLCEDTKKELSFKLLARRDKAIKAIAFELGFSNPSAFNRAFKRWTGESPASYRKGVLGNN